MVAHGECLGSLVCNLAVPLLSSQASRAKYFTEIWTLFVLQCHLWPPRSHLIYVESKRNKAKHLHYFGSPIHVGSSASRGQWCHIAHYRYRTSLWSLKVFVIVVHTWYLPPSHGPMWSLMPLHTPIHPGWREKEPEMCVSHDGKACHSAWSTRTPLFRPQKQQPKGASFCFTGGSRVTRRTRTDIYNYAGRGDTWGPPQPQVTQEFHQTPSPSAHTKRGFLSSHRPLWPASASAPSSSLVLGSKETAASEYKEVPTVLAVSVCSCHRVGLSSLGCEGRSELLLHPRGSRHHELVTS